VNDCEQNGKNKAQQKGWEVKKRAENRGGEMKTLERGERLWKLAGVSDNVKNIWS
jgi:hypothetical protein